MPRVAGQGAPAAGTVVFRACLLGGLAVHQGLSALHGQAMGPSVDISPELWGQESDLLADRLTVLNSFHYELCVSVY